MAGVLQARDRVSTDTLVELLAVELGYHPSGGLLLGAEPAQADAVRSIPQDPADAPGAEDASHGFGSSPQAVHTPACW